MKTVFILISICFITNFAKADEWQLKAGRATDIAIGANGMVWSIGNTPSDGSFNIQFWTGIAWQNIDGGGIRIAVDPDGNPWVINRANQIFKREANRWVLIPGLAKDIGIGADGSVWKINLEPSNVIPVFGSTIQKWNGTTWVGIAGVIGADRISVGPNGQPFVVTTEGTIHEAVRGAGWVTYIGRAKDISLGANGSLWVIGTIPKGGGSYSIHKWNVDAWEELDGGGNQIAVDAEGKPWVTNHLFEIYKRAYTRPVYNATEPSVNPIIHDYPYTGTISCIAANPINHNNILVASGSGGVYETNNALGATRTWTYNSSLTNPHINDIIFAFPGAAFTALAAADETFKNNATTPQIWQKNSSGTWSLARFVAGTSIPANKTACYKIVKTKTGTLDTYYACGDFGIAVYGISGTEWTIISDFPANTSVYSIATLKNGTLIAGTPSGIYSFDFLSGAFGGTRVRWPIVNATMRFTDPGQRYQLNADFSGSIFLSINRSVSNHFFYSEDGASWSSFNLPAVYTGAAGGIVSVYLDSIINGNYSIFVSDRYKFYQANLYGSNPLSGLNYLSNNRTQLQWSEPIQPGHDDTRHFLRLRGSDGTNKIVMTSDGGFHISNFSYGTAGGYRWQTDRTTSGLNNLEVYNLTGTNRITNFGTQHNGFGALNSSFGLIGTNLNEGYVLDRKGMGDVDARTIVFAPDPRFPTGLSVQGPAFGTAPYTVCGTPHPFWIGPNNGWGNPIWLGNRMYIQDATPADATPSVFPWRISIDNGCTWQNLPDGNSIRRGMNAFFSVRNNVEQNLFVALQGSSEGAKLAKLVNPHISRSRTTWAYPAMTNLQGGIRIVGADFLFNPLYCVNPSNPDNILALENNTGKLKVSNDGGNNWTESSSFTSALTTVSNFKGSKGGYSIRAMRFSPFDPLVIMIGTSTEGFFISRDGGISWRRHSFPGLYNITDFHWVSPNVIIISTYGRGLFQMSI